MENCAEKCNNDSSFDAPIERKLVLDMHQKIVFVLSFSFVVLLMILLLSALMNQRQCYCEPMHATIVPNTDESSSSNSSNNSQHGLRIRSRAQWFAAPPANPLPAVDSPASRVIIAHTATENCNSIAVCSYCVRGFQKFHMESRGWDDISYNFLIGGDGYVYEGRGWNKLGACSKRFNEDSICISFIGTFINVEPTDQQLQIAQELLHFGIKLNKLKIDYRLYGHRQVMATESPGAKLYNIIMTSNHWQPI